jgi:phosphate uptake regulator
MPMLEMGAKAPAEPTERPSTGPRAEEATSIRILQRMGPVSLGVSLPRNWVASYRLRVGSPVQVRVLPGGSIRLHPGDRGPSGERRFTVEVSSRTLPEHLFRSLLGAYLAGASDFEIFQPGGIRPETRGVARTFGRRTISPQVISEEDERLHLRDASEASPVSLDKLLGRMGQLVLQLHRDAAETWSRLHAGSGTSWQSRDDEVDRQAWFIERSAVRMLDGELGLLRGPSEGIGPLGCWTVARSLERIADHAVRMGEAGTHLAEGAVPPAHLVSLGQFHDQSLRHLDAVLVALGEGTGAEANELLDAGEALHEVARTLSERLFPSAMNAVAMPAASAIALGHILESIDRTVAYAQDIAQVALDRALPLTAESPAEAAGPASHSSTMRNTQGGSRKK